MSWLSSGLLPLPPLLPHSNSLLLPTMLRLLLKPFRLWSQDLNPILIILLYHTHSPSSIIVAIILIVMILIIFI